jgi:predicted methyltransferase
MDMTGKLFEAALYVNLRLAGSQRTDAGKARDVYRRPDETMTVVEDGPGGGCYTRILAPCLNCVFQRS